LSLASTSLKIHLSGETSQNTDPASSLGGERAQQISDYSMYGLFGDAPAGAAIQDYRCVYFHVGTIPELEINGATIHQSGTLNDPTYALAVDPGGINCIAQRIPDAVTSHKWPVVSELRSTLLTHGAYTPTVAALTGNYFVTGDPVASPDYKLWQYNTTTRALTAASFGQTIPTALHGRAAVLIGNRLLDFGETNILRHTAWSESDLSLTDLQEIPWPFGTPGAVAYHASSGKLVAYIQNDLDTFTIDRDNNTATRDYEHTISPKIRAMTFLGDYLIFLQADGTAHFARYNPDDGSLGTFYDLTLALPDTLDFDTGMTILGNYLLYYVDVVGNNFRSYEITDEPPFAEHGISDPLALGDLDGTQNIPIWIRRTIQADHRVGPAGTTLTISGDSP